MDDDDDDQRLETSRGRRQHDDGWRQVRRPAGGLDAVGASGGGGGGGGNKGSAQQERKAAPGGKSCHRHSYSKIFLRQLYLAAASGARNLNNSSRKEEASSASPSSSSNLIASALNRLKIVGASDCSSLLVASGDDSADVLRVGGGFGEDRRPQTGGSGGGSGGGGTSGNFRRKGFLYLKRAGNESARTARREQEEPHQSLYQHQHHHNHHHHQRDLNNNNNNNSVKPDSSQHLPPKRNEVDEHKTCLLEEIECEEESSGRDNRKEPMANKKIGQKRHQEEKMGKRGSSSISSSSKMATTGGGSLLLCLAVGAIITLLVLLPMSGRGQQQQQQPRSHLQSSPSDAGRGPGVGSVRPQPAAGSLVANINCNKIRGHVTLTPNAQGGGSTVSTQILSGPAGEVYQWSVHQFPVKPGAAMCSCSPMILGSKLLDLSEMHGNLPSDQEFNVQSSLSLFGPDSPVGHSLMLRGMKTGMVACATFLPTSRKSNYRAKFHTPLSGSVTIFQTAFGTSFISHLMYSNGTRRHSLHRFDLVKSEDDLVSGSPVVASLAGQSASAISAAASRLGQEQLVWEQREHEHELSQCRRFGQGEPLLRNMSYQLAVSTENFGMRGRTSLVLNQIPFESFSSVMVVVYSEHDPQEPIACAPLRFVKPKTAAAKFQSVSVQGSVVFSQDSPYDPTVARVQLQLPNSDGHSYGIDELPMIIRRKSDQRVCPNIREIIYNPHHVEPSSVPGEGEATSDQYAVGDLSGKYGSLTGKSSEKLQVQDFNLPLYGPISVVGRAMTVYSADGVAIACSNLELTTPMTTAFATFDFGIQGQFIFRQPVNDCNGDTYVYIEVSKPVGTAAATQQQQQQTERSIDHSWHIHTEPVDSGLEHLSSTECQAAGAHFNPYNTSTSGIYSRDCTPFNVLRCELGDLSAKMFTIEIPPYRVKQAGQEPDIGKFFGTDIDLPLCGPVSVVNRSVVVHVQDFGSQRLACSTVIEFKPRT